MKKKRSFLKWAGGKYFLLNEIKKHLPLGECLIEPFVGSGSVFLNTSYPQYILADINRDLIALYKILKLHTDEYVKEARKLFTPANNNSEAYYLLRNEFNQSNNLFYRALLFLYLNRHGYNGLCRYNLRGEFNVPFGCYEQPYFPYKELYDFAEKAQGVFFVCESYIDSMSRADKNSVIYCDPPYVALSKVSSFTAYYTNRFSLEQQACLARIAENLSSNYRIPVLISNHDTKLTRMWYQLAELYFVKVQRSISRNSHTRKCAKELLALYKS